MSQQRLVVRLLSLASGVVSTLDGQWLVEYDPTRDGVSPLGLPMRCHLICSTARDKAKVFADIAELQAYVYAESGKPAPANMPLAAYNLEVQLVDGSS